MSLKLTWRMMTEPDKRLLWKFAYNMGWKGMLAVNRFEKRKKKGEDTFPAFLMISVTNDCNLRCQGCWVTPSKPATTMSSETLDRVISESKAKGSYFFGILGGEPLMYKGLFDVLAGHPDCYFQIFTNGTLLTEDIARQMRKLGNISPLVSVEGLEKVSDERRGGSGVYGRAIDGLTACCREKLITGVATSVCASNFDDLVSDKFVKDLVDIGVLYVWYYIFRPVGPDPSPDLALSEEQILALRQFIVDSRMEHPIIVVDAYWDHEGRALCPAAVGISHHINPAGEIEPCPPIQFAKDRVGEGFAGSFDQSGFLARFREWASGKTRGCVLLEYPKELGTVLEEEGARDTTGRGKGLEELSAMEPRPGHHLPGKEVREKNWQYRLAKKYWFFGFGAYG
ncbi:radical SAM/SPASM domain-containing protein [Verrucomicrobiota bacterium]